MKNQKDLDELEYPGYFKNIGALQISARDASIWVR